MNSTYSLSCPFRMTSAIGSLISAASRDATIIKIASPFLTDIERIDVIAAAGCKIDLFFRADGIKDPKYMRALFLLQSRGLQINSKVTWGDWFHSKLYLFERRSPPNRIAIIGSGNFTVHGLTRGHEVAASFTDNRSYEELAGVFGELWSSEDRVAVFTEEIVKKAEERWAATAVERRKLGQEDAIFWKTAFESLAAPVSGAPRSSRYSDKFVRRTVSQSAKRGEYLDLIGHYLVDNPKANFRTRELVDGPFNQSHRGAAAEAIKVFKAENIAVALGRQIHRGTDHFGQLSRAERERKMHSIIISFPDKAE